jgi:hypothetical protein
LSREHLSPEAISRFTFKSVSVQQKYDPVWL